MPDRDFAQYVRDEVRQLIAEAVIEPESARRRALLNAADHWLAGLKGEGRIRRHGLFAVGA